MIELAGFVAAMLVLGSPFIFGTVVLCLIWWIAFGRP